VDYVHYAIRTRRGTSLLGLWFGPYAISSEPDEKRFIESVSFEQRSLLVRGETAGIDSYGKSLDGKYWRQTGMLGSGAEYEEATKKDAEVFNQIIESICYTPYDSN
jgi:hypothetical protein